MGGKNSAPPPPDYKPVADASKEAAQIQAKVAREQLAWAREQYKRDRQILNPIVKSAMERMNRNDRNAMADRARYERTFQPLEDQLAQDATDFASPERQRDEMGRAQATVAQQFDASRKAAIQNLESFGVDPSSTRFAALDAGSRAAEAASKAAAGNNARAQTEAMGRAMRSEAINVGRGYPGQIAGTYGTALQSGQQGANTQLAGTASGANTMGTAPQYYGLSNQAIGNWGNMLTQGYNAQMAQYNANQNSSSGLGSLFGGLLGAAGNAGGFGALFAGLAEGGEVAHPDVTPGGNVPNDASPSNGQAIDDVPAMLTAGEFVLPKDVVAWKGEEWAQKEIQKAREAKAKAQARPKVAIAPAQPPAFVSRSASALPVG